MRRGSKLHSVVTLSLIFGVFFSIFAIAAPNDLYQVLNKPDCQVSKFSNGQWAQESPAVWSGKKLNLVRVFPSGLFLLSDGSAQLSTKPECVTKLMPPPPLQKNEKKIGVLPFTFQLRGVYAFHGAAPTAVSTTQYSAFSPSIGFDLREYYSWDRKNSVFLNLSKSGGTQAATDTTGWSSTQSDSIWSLRFGYQTKLATEGAIPYFSFLVGLSKFSSTTTVSGTQSGVITSSATPLTGALEAGMYFPLGKRLKGILALSYNYITSGTQTVSDSTVSSYAAGTAIPSANYSNVAIHFGLAY